MSNRKGVITFFILGLTAAVNVRLIGVISIAEIFCLFLLPAALVNAKFHREYTMTFVLFFIWLLSVLTFDVINNVGLLNSMKGFFSVFTFGSLLLFFSIKLRDLVLFEPFILGFSISMFLSNVFGLDVFYHELAIESGSNVQGDLAHFPKLLYSAFNFLFIFILGIKLFANKRKIFISVMIILVILGGLVGSRSVMAIDVLVIFFSFIYPHFNKQNKLGRFNSILVRLTIVTIVVIASMGSYIFYFALVKNNLLDDTELTKFESQSSSNIGILAGRGDIVSASLAIIDKPITGHGSYALDINGYNMTALILLGLDDLKYFDNNKELIGAHSHIFGAWVFNGIFGFVFWLIVLFKLINYLLSPSIFILGRYFPLIVFLISQNIWNILFSPFSQKVFLAFTLILVIFLQNKHKHNYSAQS